MALSLPVDQSLVIGQRQQLRAIVIIQAAAGLLAGADGQKAWLTETKAVALLSLSAPARDVPI